MASISTYPLKNKGKNGINPLIGQGWRRSQHSTFCINAIGLCWGQNEPRRLKVLSGNYLVYEYLCRGCVAIARLTKFDGKHNLMRFSKLMKFAKARGFYKLTDLHKRKNFSLNLAKSLQCPRQALYNASMKSLTACFINQPCWTKVRRTPLNSASASAGNRLL